MKLRFVTRPPQNHFPIQALQEMVRRAVWATHCKIQAPISMVAPIAIGVMSEAVQGLVNVQIPDGPLCPATNWIWINADSGMGKTPSLNMLRKPISIFEMGRHENHQKMMKAYYAERRGWELELAECEQAVRKAVRQGLDKQASKQRLVNHMALQPKPPRKLTLTYQDVTPEAFCQRLSDNWPHASLINDEAASYLNGPMGAAMPMLNQRWEIQPLSIERVSRDKPVYVQDPRVTLIWTMQPDPFARYMERRGQEARELGMLSRFQWSQPDNNQGWRDVRPVEVDPQEMEGFYQRVTECLQASIGEGGEPLGEKRIITFSSEATARYHLFRANIERALLPGGILEQMKDYAAKAPRHLARLAGMLEFFESGKTVISLETLERAITLMNWFIYEYKRIFVPMPAIPQEQQDADRLQSWLQQFVQKRGNRYLIKNDVRKHVLSELRDKTRLDRSLGVLMQRGWITQWSEGKVGMIDTMPHTIHDQFAMSAALQTYRASRTKLSY
ncbi:YfjI family protein [Chromobacterium subtsugae]|uniref:YfjI family protein n=1 Tax=Chromobacterium subtsugae TaxID=251747 RepID=UPI0009B93217|nr:YfjI family protein [Chromobacterium subtsugae]